MKTKAHKKWLHKKKGNKKKNINNKKQKAKCTIHAPSKLFVNPKDIFHMCNSRTPKHIV